MSDSMNKTDFRCTNSRSYFPTERLGLGFKVEINIDVAFEISYSVL